MEAIATLSSSVIGNFTIEPENFLNCLKKSTYYLDYDRKTRTITFWMNDGSGGKNIFEITNASYENAEKIAHGLHLKEEQPGHWGKWNPQLSLDHDGSEAAETLRLEMLRLGIPHTVQRTTEFAFYNHPYRYKLDTMWNLDDLLKVVREDAERYKEQLQTTP